MLKDLNVSRKTKFSTNYKLLEIKTLLPKAEKKTSNPSCESRLSNILRDLKIFKKLFWTWLYPGLPTSKRLDFSLSFYISRKLFICIIKYSRSDLGLWKSVFVCSCQRSKCMCVSEFWQQGKKMSMKEDICISTPIYTPTLNFLSGILFYSILEFSVNHIFTGCLCAYRKEAQTELVRK